MTFLQGFKGGSTTFLSKSGAERVEVVPKINGKFTNENTSMINFITQLFLCILD
jgi:hypothetical protein